MRILISGAGGFIGSTLTRSLLNAGRLKDRQGRLRDIDRILVVDSHLPFSSDIRLEHIRGDISDEVVLQRVADWQPDSVFHLAAILTSAAERDPARALAVNVSALARLIDVIGSQSRRPRIIFPSSIAVFGGVLPDVVDDDLVQRPQTSYGTHKAIVELMLADATRRSEIDGRALRLPIVLVHPGPPTASVSDRIAGIVRDAVAGRDVIVPLASATRVPVVSVQAVAASLIAIHDADTAQFGGATAVNLPALTVSMADIVASLRAVPGASQPGHVRFAPDPELETIVAGWPKGFVSRRAAALGVAGDADFSQIVQHYIASCQNAQ